MGDEAFSLNTCAARRVAHPLETVIRVLITSAGRRVELLDAFRAAAARLGRDIVVVAADADPQRSPACHLADEAHALPRCSDSLYADAVLSLAEQRDLDVIVPVIDDELIPLARAHARFSAASRSLVLSESDAVDVAADKFRTIEALRPWVVTPRTWMADEAPSDAIAFPAMVKPVYGSSSIGARVVADFAQVPRGCGYVVQELLSGAEHTVNVYTARCGRLVAAVAHQRLRVRGGEVMQGVVVESPALCQAAAAIQRALPGLRGPWCFQAFLDADDTPSVFEVNARFGGGYPLADAAGAPFAEWILREHLNLPLPDAPAVRIGLTMLRYDRSLFLEG
jgi:carbamoyl-phosphate synthase large subunit